MARPNNITMCSFCGKSHAEVRKLVSGPGVYICDNCIILCKNVLDRELQVQNQKKSPKFSVPKPAEIKRQLDLYIVGQEHAKKRWRWLSIIISSASNPNPCRKKKVRGPKILHPPNMWMLRSRRATF